MSMVLCNAPTTFTTMMNEVLEGYIDRFRTVYLDDVLIFSKTAEDYYSHVAQVPERLQDHRLYASKKTCFFMTNEVEFLGVIVSDKCLKVNLSKIEVLKKWPQPQSIRETQGFVVLASFFGRFIKDFSQISNPLVKLTKENMSINEWDVECAKAMDHLSPPN